MSMRLAGRLVAARRFGPMLGSQGLGAFTDNMLKQALLTLAAFGTLSVPGAPQDAIVPIAAALFTAPMFLFSALAGQVADKYDKAMVMRRTKFVEMVLMAIAAFAFVVDSGLLLLSCLFFMGVQSAFFAPAKNGSMPFYLKADELVTGNALMQGVLFLAILTGTGAGVLLILRDGGPLLIAAALIIASVGGWLLIKLTPTGETSDPGLIIRWNIFTETWRLLAFAAANGKVLRPMLGVAWFWLLSAAILTLLPLYARDSLYMDETVVFVFMALFTLGAALGSAACGVFSKGRESAPISAIGAVGIVVFSTDIFLASLGRAPTLDASGEIVLSSAKTFFADWRNWRLAFDFVMAAASAGLFVVPLQAMVQARADRDKRARIMAAGNILNALAATVGQFSLLAITLSGLPRHTAFLALALASAAVAAYMARRHHVYWKSMT
ncbi:MAG: MFS transporter [Pseudomonadota bacterium]